MQAIILQIVGALLSVTLIILFYSKPNIENIETKVYAKLIKLNFLFILVGILTFFIAKFTNNLDLIGFFQKIYMSILTLLNLYLMYYCLDIYDKKDYFNKMKKILFIVTIITILGILFLPLEVIYDGILLDGNGLSYDVAILHTMLSFVVFMIITIYFINKKYSIRKMLPYIILIIFYLIGFFLRKYYKELIFEGFFYSYMLLIMYNTIENPDVKIAKELSFQKKLADEYSKKTMNLIYEIEYNLQSTIKELKKIGNMKINEESKEELIETLYYYQNKANLMSDRIANILDLAMLKSENKTDTYKYNTKEMLNKLEKILETEKNEISLDIKISDNIPPILYGVETEVIKTVLYFYNMLSSIVIKEQIKLKIDSMQINKFLKLRFNFELNNQEISKYLILNFKTKEYLLKNINNIYYQLFTNLLERNNGKLVITRSDTKINLVLSFNQKLISEYEDVSTNINDYSNKRILIVSNDYKKVKEISLLLKPYNIEYSSVNSMKELTRVLTEDKTFDLIIIVDDFLKNNENNLISYIRKKIKYKIIIVNVILESNFELKEKYNLEYDDVIKVPISKEQIDKILNKLINKGDI